MAGDMAMKDAPAVVRDDEKTIEHAEGQRRHGEKVHCCNRLAVVGKERRPAPGRLRTPWRFSHPTQYASLRDFEAEHLRLSVDARRAPSWILDSHAGDLLAQILADGFSACALRAAREPDPVPRKPRPMPAHDGIGLDQDQSLFPARPNPAQNPPKEFVGCVHLGTRTLAFEDGELLAQGQIFKKQIAARPDRPQETTKEKNNSSKHDPL